MLAVEQAGEQPVYFKVNSSTQMGKVFACYANRTGRARNALSFLLDGELVAEDSTPNSLDLLDGDKIACRALEDTAVAAGPTSAEAAASTPAPRDDGGPPAALELAPEGEGETAAAAVTAEAAAATAATTPAGATAPAAEPAATYVRDGEPTGLFNRAWFYASEARKKFGLSEAQLRAVPGAVARVPEATRDDLYGFGPWWPKAAVSCLAHVRVGLASSFLH